MEKIAREKFQQRLQNEWQNYVGCYQRLDPAAQRAFVDKQGYASFGSLLGHIIAWWQDGALNIQKMRGDPAFPLADYDVDAFNARAVEKYHTTGEPAMLQAFEAQRQAMLALVNDLSEAEIGQENINTRLYYEILMHWTEHELS